MTNLASPLIGAVLALALCGGASAADICRAIALRDVSAIGAPSSVLRSGKYDDAVSVEQASRETGLSLEPK